MQSPFAIFRKYQKECILVFGFLILISFTVGQSLIDISSRTGQIPLALKIALAVTLVGGISWGIGLQRDRAKEYGLWGVLAGAAIGVALGQFGGAAAAVSTNAGNLSETDIQRLVKQRKIVNQFLYDGVDATFMNIDDPRMASFRSQFVAQTARSVQFQFNPRQLIQYDVVFGFLLQQEAKRMGIRVSDESISQFINRATSENLSREKFNEIRKRQNVSQKELYDMLRAELLALAALRQSQPTPQTTPGEYWQMYRKMKVTQQLEAVAIPVADFETDLSQPTKSDIKRFFEEHKERFANQEGTGKPGFRQPRRIQVGFFEPDYEVIEADVIKALESEHITPKEEKEALETAIGELKKLLEAEGEPTRLEFEIASRYERDKDFLHKIDPLPEDDDTKKDDTKKDDTKKDDTKKDDTKKDDAKKDDVKKDDAKKPSPKQDVPKEKDAPKKKDDSGGAAALDRVKGSTSPVAFLQDEPKKDVPKKDVPQKKDDSKKKDTVKKDDTKKPKPKKSEPKKDPPQAKTNDEKKKSPAGKTDKTKPEPGEKKAEKTDDGEKVDPKPNYQPLDDDLKDDIRDQIINDKTQDEEGRRIKIAVDDYLQSLSFALNTGTGKDGKPLSLRQATVEMRNYAKQHGLVYVVTPRLSVIDLRDSEDYAIAKSKVPGGSSQTILPDLFDDGRQLFLVGLGEEDFRVPRYAYIRINDAAQHVPRLEPLEKPGSIQATELNEELGFEWIKPSEDIVTLQDYIKKELGGIPKKDVKLERGRFRITILESDGRTISKVRLGEQGIDEQVRKAWLLAKARPNAEKRAKELVSLVKSAKEGTLAETLEGKTVTGKKGSLELDEPITTSPFSWLRQPQVPPLGMQQRQSPPPQLSSLPILGTGGGQVGSDFMETVFNKLKNGEVGVVSNAKRTVYFVVKVVQRSPLDPERDEDFRKQFLAEDVVGGGGQSASPYEYLAGARFQEMTTRWSQELNTKYGVEWDPAYQARLAQ
jgi:hypothetical protein